ncbi:MAG TPA: urea transporter, partial [Taishania sp.]|nr:urea transporter [Taishania sp.]
TALVFSSYKQNTHWLALVGILLTILLEYIFRHFHLFDAFGGVLTFPFVLATWVTLFINKNIFNK